MLVQQLETPFRHYLSIQYYVASCSSHVAPCGKMWWPQHSLHFTADHHSCISTILSCCFACLQSDPCTITTCTRTRKLNFTWITLFCRYNYTVYQDTEHGRQKIVKDGVDTLISVVDSVSSSSQDFAWHSSCFDCQDKIDVVFSPVTVNRCRGHAARRLLMQ